MRRPIRPQRSYAMDRSYIATAHVESSSGWYEVGYVTTRWGVVGVYREEAYYTLRVARDGRYYERHIERAPTRRGLLMTASRFARYVLGGAR